MRSLALTALSLPLLAAPAAGQVVISEVAFDSSQQWIEITNMGSSAADLGTWSLYSATDSPGGPPPYCNGGQGRCYWWAFPGGTQLQPGATLRVNWLAPIQPNTATELYTGTTVFHFLFGYLAEPLHPDSGALALLSSQQNSAMNDPSIFRDWVQWATPGLPREDLAVQAGIWEAGSAAPVPQSTDSLALIYPRKVAPANASAWFRDATPTPNANNHPGAALPQDFGNACAVGTVATPALSTTSIPTQGNRDFSATIDNTTSSQQVLLVLGARGSSGVRPLPGSPCELFLDATMPVVVLPLMASAGTTPVPVSMLTPGLAGGTVSVQAVTFVGLVDHGFTQAVEISVGG